MKNIKYGANKHNRTHLRKRFHTHEKAKYNHSRKHKVLRWGIEMTSFGRFFSSSYPCKSRYDVGTGLRIMSHGYKHSNL